MQLRQYSNRWQQINLGNLAGATKNLSPAGPELYADFYAQLTEGGSVSERWAKDKATLGTAIASEVFENWTLRYGRRPRVLALAVGQGVAEGVWLEQGYDVTLHDCQQTSMRQLCERFPHARTFIADLRGIVITGNFDIVAMLASEYVLANQELTALLRAVAGSLNRHGWVVLHSVSILSAVRYAKEVAKRLRGGYPSPEHVFWGWWRTSGELTASSADAGLQVAKAYRALQMPGGGTVLRPRSRGLRSAPTWSDDSLVLVLERSEGRRPGD